MEIRPELKGRSLLTLRDLTDDEMLHLLDLAADLKACRREGRRGHLIDGKQIAMVFEKMSTRTRCAASVAAADEGGRAEYLAAHEIHLGKKESVADTARVLGRMFDGILFRGYAHETVEKLAAMSGVPVWNGLTDDSHPTQALADLMTVREKLGRLSDVRVVYVGDGRNNVANSLMLACAKAGLDFVNCAPAALAPAPELVVESAEIAERNGGSVRVLDDPAEAATGANAIYTDVWVSMGEEAEREERVRLLRPYQVNMALIERTGRLDSGDLVFLHCLPAFHDHNTDLTRECGAMEVTDDVFEAPFSAVFDQAENRMHTIKAMFVATVR